MKLSVLSILKYFQNIFSYNFFGTYFLFIFNAYHVIIFEPFILKNCFTQSSKLILNHISHH